jgi:hypothetical protein
MQKVMRFATTLTDVQTPFGLFIPKDGVDLALRVYCRYLPQSTPPPPQVVVVVAVQDPPTAFAEQPDAQGNPVPLQVLRNFMLWPLEMDLPTTFVKFIGTVPFGADKTGYDIIEVGA